MTDRLTSREQYIVDRLARGRTLRQIAHEADVTNARLSNLLVDTRVRFGCTTTTQLVAKLVVEGITSPYVVPVTTWPTGTVRKPR